MGIDPGVGRVGWGVIGDEFGKQTALDYGCLETSSKLKLDERLKEIHDFILTLVVKYKPEVMAIEQLFFAANSKTAFMVGQARGVILLAASQNQLPTVAYTPLQVKQSLTGYGKAEKKQIQIMVKAILGLKLPVSQDDAADALAIALTHAFSYKLQTLSQ